jgi:hypothetical protein
VGRKKVEAAVSEKFRTREQGTRDNRTSLRCTAPPPKKSPARLRHQHTHNDMRKFKVFERPPHRAAEVSNHARPKKPFVYRNLVDVNPQKRVIVSKTDNPQKPHEPPEPKKPREESVYWFACATLYGRAKSTWLWVRKRMPLMHASRLTGRYHLPTSTSPYFSCLSPCRMATCDRDLRTRATTSSPYQKIYPLIPNSDHEGIDLVSKGYLDSVETTAAIICREVLRASSDVCLHPRESWTSLCTDLFVGCNPPYQIL